jgi:hypothetical protein
MTVAYGLISIDLPLLQFGKFAAVSEPNARKTYKGVDKKNS